MDWANAYVGRPWETIGRERPCWALVRWAYRERCGIELPAYAGGHVDEAERAEIAGLLSAEPKSGPWRAVEPGAEREMDVLVFRRAGLDRHVGLVVIRPGLMLHVSQGIDSEIVRYRDGKWALRLSGIYRHEALA